jgi:hypothetical protein
MTLVEESTKQHETARKMLEDQVGGLRAQVDASAEESRRANEIAEYVFGSLHLVILIKELTIGTGSFKRS